MTDHLSKNLRQRRARAETAIQGLQECVSAAEKRLNDLVRNSGAQVPTVRWIERVDHTTAHLTDDRVGLVDLAEDHVLELQGRLTATQEAYEKLAVLIGHA